MVCESLDIPQTQLALVQDAQGQPVLSSTVGIPILKPNTVLVKVFANAVNPCDFKMGTNFPTEGAIIGSDFVGDIVRMSPEVKDIRPDLKLGDRVCGFVHGSNPADPGNGGFAEYLRAHAQLLYKVPLGLDPLAAAAMGVGLQTAALSLWYTLRLPHSPDNPVEASIGPKYVLVYGASTASGSMILQLLKLSGYTAIATCSRKNFDLVKSFGASHVFDYADDKTAESIRKLTGSKLEYALDCITDKQSVECCYGTIARTGGRYTTLELCPASMRPVRRAVKHDWIFALDIFGEPIPLSKGYERDASPETYQFAVHWYKVFQRLLDEGKLRPHPLEELEPGFEGIR
ncbi:NADP-dependent alcohol dehydrogenase 7 [Sphaceloma murrayae]|uniref:NADP-dependent alcohol dehydrogenase 7 n=1 Tax=Sphaceloma murrayae TaxID=2082308 RepID=A0A2K1QVW2_9PEZI|nr:NADP-dependent alcohol dehydrogenase 7 [Sphaceloma murrayae]